VAVGLLVAGVLTGFLVFGWGGMSRTRRTAPALSPDHALTGLPAPLPLPQEEKPGPAPAAPATVASIAALAATDPERALAIALGETNPQVRTELLKAALRVWAAHDFAAATTWVSTHPGINAEEMLGVLLDAPGESPVAAAALTQQLASAHPAQARDYGYALIFALNRAGAYDQAAAYAVNGPERIRNDLLIAAYHDWGRKQPALALQSALHLTDGTIQDTAVQSVLSGWARENPEELAENALSFPEGPVRNAALTKAVRSWMIQDPWKAGDWVMSHQDVAPAAEAAFRKD